MVKVMIKFYCVYNPPCTNINTSLQSALDELRENCPTQNLVLLGDFNLPDINWTKCTVLNRSNYKNMHRSFLEMAAEFELHQHIYEPTHVKGNTLDLVFSSQQDKIFNCQVIEPGLSDHFLISFNIKMSKYTEKSLNKIINLYYKADTKAIVEDLSRTQKKIEQHISENAHIDVIWENFVDDLRETIKKNVPTKSIRPRNPHEPIWFNSAARKLVNRESCITHIRKQVIQRNF